MKKTKKIVLILLVISVAITSLYAGIHTIYVQAHRGEAVEYLVEKYGFDSKELILLDYEPSKFHDDTKWGIPFDWYRNNCNWLIKYKGRCFSVVKNYETNAMLDNYQFEELFKWGTDYLQKNINPNIAGFKIEIIGYEEKYEQTDIKSYFQEQSKLTVYYKSDSIEKYYDQKKYNTNNLYKSIKNEVQEKIISQFGALELSLFIVDKSVQFSRVSYKTEDTYYYKFETAEKTYELYEEGRLIGD